MLLCQSTDIFIRKFFGAIVQQELSGIKVGQLRIANKSGGALDLAAEINHLSSSCIMMKLRWQVMTNH
jgi:hypothetical protein